MVSKGARHTWRRSAFEGKGEHLCQRGDNCNGRCQRRRSSWTVAKKPALRRAGAFLVSALKPLPAWHTRISQKNAFRSKFTGNSSPQYNATYTPL